MKFGGKVMMTTGMTGEIHETMVDGVEYVYWSDFGIKGTFAAPKDKEDSRKQISYSGYIHKDLTVRKAIAAAFGLKTFRR